MKTYETIFILDNRKVEDGGETFSKKVGKFVDQLGGKVQKVVSLGRRHFARPIGKHRAGVYWDFIMDLEPGHIVALQDQYRLDSTVLRLEVLKYQEGSDPAKFARSKR